MFARYASSKFHQIQIEEAYRDYISDCLQMLTENTARASIGGQYMRDKMRNLLNHAPVDNRTGDEIAADVIKRAGLEVTKSGSI